MRLLTALPLAFLVSAAWAEPVTYQLTGTVISVTDGTNGTVDLRGSFSNGQAATFDMTVERSTAGTPSGGYYTTYVNAVTGVVGTIGTYSFSSKFPTTTLYVGNDNPDNGFFNDDLFVIVQPLTGDPIGSLNLFEANFSFQDQTGASFASQALPRIFPASIPNSMICQVDVSWVSLSGQGVVRVVFNTSTTPAQSTTWGGIKNLYRQ